MGSLRRGGLAGSETSIAAETHDAGNLGIEENWPQAIYPPDNPVSLSLGGACLGSVLSRRRFFMVLSSRDAGLPPPPADPARPLGNAAGVIASVL